MISPDIAAEISKRSQRLIPGQSIAVAHDGQYMECWPGDTPMFCGSVLGCWVCGPAEAHQIAEQCQISEEIWRDDEEPYVGVVGERVN